MLLVSEEPNDSDMLLVSFELEQVLSEIPPGRHAPKVAVSSRAAPIRQVAFGFEACAGRWFVCWACRERSLGVCWLAGPCGVDGRQVFQGEAELLGQDTQQVMEQKKRVQYIHLLRNPFGRTAPHGKPTFAYVCKLTRWLCRRCFVFSLGTLATHLLPRSPCLCVIGGHFLKSPNRC